MSKTISVYGGTSPIPIQYNPIAECPVCHTTLDPIILHEIITTTEDTQNAMLSVLAFCRKCRNTFLSTYSVMKDEAFFREKRCYDTRLIQTVPFTPISQEFSEKIIQVSPKFVDIYNQSYQAEQLHLSDICGMGYRKALEFLIKDYLIFMNPADKDSVESMPLSQCVNKLHDLNPSLKNVAKAAVWLGNDETHFIRKHMNYSTEDLKRFIRATVLLIDLMFTIEEATSIQSQK